MFFDRKTPYNITMNLTALNRIRRHDNYVSDIRDPTCALVQILPLKDRCTYVRSTIECEESLFLFNYVNLYYCYLKPDGITMVLLSIVVLLLICALLFIILGSTADVLFCPSLKVISKILGMSETIAGVTLLAFGNSSPDLFTSLTGLSGESRRIYSDIYGAGIFVNLFIGGIIALVVPFATLPAAFLREIGFYMFSLFYIEYVIITEPGVTIFEAICTLLIYGIYIVVLLIDQFLVKRQTKIVEDEVYSQNLKGTYSTKSLKALKSLKSEAVIDVVSRDATEVLAKGRSGHRVLDSKDRFYDKYNARHSRNHKLFIQLKETVIDGAFDLQEFRDENIVSKFFQLLRAPILFTLRCIIPVIDYELPMNGWSKLLNSIQIVICPSFLIIGIVGFKGFYVPFCVWIWIVTIPLAIWVFIVTRTDIPPKAHDCFSILSIFGSVYIIYASATETNAVLDVIGISTYRSNSFLGCTVLGWGNSIGDLVANIALAKQGYEKMGFAACYGGPIFNSVMTIGATFVYKSWSSPDQIYRLAKGTMGENCFRFLAIALPCVLLATVSTNFVMRRSLGALMVLIYLVYFLYCFLGELEIIHTFGSDHSQDLKVDPIFD